MALRVPKNKIFRECLSTAARLICVRRSPMRSSRDSSFASPRDRSGRRGRKRGEETRGCTLTGTQRGGRKKQRPPAAVWFPLSGVDSGPCRGNRRSGRTADSPETYRDSAACARRAAVANLAWGAVDHSLHRLARCRPSVVLHKSDVNYEITCMRHRTLSVRSRACSTALLHSRSHTCRRT